MTFYTSKDLPPSESIAPEGGVYVDFHGFEYRTGIVKMKDFLPVKKSELHGFALILLTILMQSELIQKNCSILISQSNQ